ncbi:hypothetical protein [Neobacillus niacini]|uniref:hypothetical protein n=1 Tax=Neobacillus niacini TaxID=86668 RepID=UPI0021CB581F|nr:hypothetical protein [Neobacillus niacini]MCM3763948.1 hypothetical protein [Neobacillus niacini]
MRQSRKYRSPCAAMLWSLMLPGFGQLYNRDFVTGFALIVLEIVINVKSELNQVLLYSFRGKLAEAHEIGDLGWGLFYPSFYAFAMWQALNFAIDFNKKQQGNEGATRTYLSGFFLGLVIGMDFGLFWHDSWIADTVPLMDYPVFNGLLFGLVFAAIGHWLEKNLYRKNKRPKSIQE